MLTLEIDLSRTGDFLYLKMPNGQMHYCTEDQCDCTAARYGDLCRHRLFIYAMGGFEHLKQLIMDERRRLARANKRTEHAPAS